MSDTSKRYSPTQLTVFTSCCPAALKFYREARNEKDAQAELDVDGPRAAEVGIAFHACAHAAALADKDDKPMLSAIEATALALTRKMAADRAEAGAAHCRELLLWWQFPKTFEFEHGMSFSTSWKRMEWSDPAARLRMVFDTMGKRDEFDPIYGDQTVAVGQDYKSGWGVKEDELDSIQMCAYTTALWKLFGDEVQAIRAEVIATRFKRVFGRTWQLDNDDDLADLRSRQARVEFYMKAADITDFKPRIGTGCGRCNHCDQCPEFQSVIDKQRKLHALGLDVISDPQEAAREMIVLETRLDLVTAYLKNLVSSGPIEIGDDVLAIHPDTVRECIDPAGVVDLWFKAAGEMKTPEDVMAATRGLLQSTGIGVTAMDKILGHVAKKLGYKTKKAAIEELGPKYSEQKPKPKFGWRKKAQKAD